MKAALRHYRQSPRKVRLLANLIKGKPVSLALAELALLPKAAARPLIKLVKSAAANTGIKETENLIIKEARVDQGRTLKRFRPRAFGRAFPIRKRTSHIQIALKRKT